jgi:toxin ParE1/3/4
MPLIFHPLVQNDLRTILRFYEEEGGSRLADRFFAELEMTIFTIAHEPTRFYFIAPRLRRANLPRFPYHLLFREDAAGVRILVLRHHQRRPDFGSARH